MRHVRIKDPLYASCSPSPPKSDRNTATNCASWAPSSSPGPATAPRTAWTPPWPGEHWIPRDVVARLFPVLLRQRPAGTAPDVVDGVRLTEFF